MRGTAILFLLLASFSCDQQTSSSDVSDEQQTSRQRANMPELRRDYARFKSAREHLPVRQIQEAGKLYPVDEALRDTTFFVWRETLLEAIRQKDIFTLMDHMAEDIKVSLGAENGTAAFIEQWDLQSAERTAQSEVWQHLERVLRNGGAFTEKDSRFVAPYVAATWPANQDSQQRALITGAGVRIREQPSLSSGIATVASHAFVNYTGSTNEETTIGGQTYSWHQIETDNGVTGYVWGKYIASPTGYRAVFARNNQGAWQIVLFMAGD